MDRQKREIFSPTNRLTLHNDECGDIQLKSSRFII